MDKTELLLQELVDTQGVSGYEGAVAQVMKKHLKDATGRISHDKLGSVISEKRGSAEDPRVMIAAHMDEIGFVVNSITKDGFLKFFPLGGWWGHVALAQRVQVLTSQGPVIGVIGSTAPHLLEPEARKKVLDIEDMYIDVGVKEKYDVQKKLGVSVGDAIVPYSPFTIMGNAKMYLGKAFDDRSGCGAIVEAAQKLAKLKHPNTLYTVGTVQEEVGLRGAGTAAYMCNPDVAVVVDVGIARDTPGMKGENVEKLGSGVSVLVFDGGLIPNMRLKELVIETAKKNKIPYVLSTMQRGATDAGRIHMSRYGVPSICIGPSARYIHGHSGIIHRDDFDACVKLLVEVVKRLDKKTVAGLTQG